MRPLTASVCFVRGFCSARPGCPVVGARPSISLPPDELNSLIVGAIEKESVLRAIEKCLERNILPKLRGLCAAFSPVGLFTSCNLACEAAAAAATAATTTVTTTAVLTTPPPPPPLLLLLLLPLPPLPLLPLAAATAVAATAAMPAMCCSGLRGCSAGV